MILRTLRRFKSARSGSVAVEFAVLSPILVALIVGAWDVGRLINTTTDLTNLARTGLHYASSKYWDEDAVKTAILAEASRQGLTDVSVSVSSTCQCSDGTIPDDCSETNACSGDWVQIYTQVSTTKGFGGTIPYPGLTQSTSFTRSGQIRVR
ncbi:MAG: TadE/TadG family type IV pilus assembly protein [Alphaproteobacteria bacterium]